MQADTMSLQKGLWSIKALGAGFLGMSDSIKLLLVVRRCWIKSSMTEY